MYSIVQTCNFQSSFAREAQCDHIFSLYVMQGIVLCNRGNLVMTKGMIAFAHFNQLQGKYTFVGTSITQEVIKAK